VFEGCDRSGKTTQCSQLSNTLTKLGINNMSFRFPTRDNSTPISSLLYKSSSNQIFLDPYTQHLLFTAERFSYLNEMVDTVQRGTTIIVDRYFHSGIAYSCASGLNRRFCEEKQKGLLNPDIIIYLNSDVQLFNSRSAKAEECFDHACFQEEVLRQYELMSDYDQWFVFDSRCSVVSLNEMITRQVIKTIHQVENQSVHYYS